MGWWTQLGQLMLLAILLGAVMTVVESVLRTIGLHSVIMRIPIIGSNFTLIISILMMWVLNDSYSFSWLSAGGLTDGWAMWLHIVASGAIVYGFVPVKDAVVSMISKGFRM
ncbi:MAG: hypothetical protein ACO26C_05670 [Ilumatobacteraceae bacterium]|mgnify:CR=1 FL=1|jgi:hypothetical protein